MKALRVLRGRFQSLVDAIRGSYWFVPMLLALAGGIGAFAMLEVDRRVGRLERPWLPWVTAPDPDGARAVLSVIAGSMVTVTGVVFSITIVALTLASSQFGPRLLRNFLRDRSNQMAFGTFVATLIFSLIVLLAVRTDGVPRLSLIASVALVIASLFVLIYFIDHTARSIQASNVIESVVAEIEAIVPSLFPEAAEDDGRDLPHEDEPAEASTATSLVCASASGFIRFINGDALEVAGRDHDLVVDVFLKPGDFVIEGLPVAKATFVGPGDPTWPDTIADAFVIGGHRTPAQDLRFLIGQLTEIAVRALSPGVNDPRTATDCVHRLGSVVSSLVRREMPEELRLSCDGRVTVRLPRLSFEEMAGSCFDAIRLHACSHPPVVAALLDAVGSAASLCTSPARFRVLRDHVDETWDAFADTKPRSRRDLATVQDSLHRARRELGLSTHPLQQRTSQ